MGKKNLFWILGLFVILLLPNISAITVNSGTNISMNEIGLNFSISVVMDSFTVNGTGIYLFNVNSNADIDDAHSSSLIHDFSTSTVEDFVLRTNGTSGHFLSQSRQLSFIDDLCDNTINLFLNLSNQLPLFGTLVVLILIIGFIFSRLLGIEINIDLETLKNIIIILLISSFLIGIAVILIKSTLSC